MGLFQAIQSALLILRTQWLRSFLTLFGMVWGTASVIFLVSWGLGVRDMLEESFTRVGKNLVQVWPGKIGEEFTPAMDRRELWFTWQDVHVLQKKARFSEIVVGEARDWKPVTYGQRLYSMDVRGVELRHDEIRGVSMEAGRFVNQTDLDHRRRVAVLGERARRILLGPHGRVGDRIRIDGKPHLVVGVLSRVGTQLWRDGQEIDDQVWVPITTFLAEGPRYGVDEEVINSVLLRARDRKLVDEAKLEAREILARRLRVSSSDHEAIIVLSPTDMLNKLPLDQIRGLLLTISVTTLLIGGIGILNMMLDSVQERRQEIGIRMAVGARRHEILGQFFLETFAITAIGGGVGLALGVGGCAVLERLALPDLIPVPILTPDIVWVALGVMAGVGFSSGLIPAWRASRIDPALTLRAE